MRAIQQTDGTWKRACSKCKSTYHVKTLEGLSEFFQSDLGKAYGVSSACKNCIQERQRIYREKKRNSQCH